MAADAALERLVRTAVVPLVGPADMHTALLRYSALDLAHSNKRSMDATIREAREHHVLSGLNSLPLVPNPFVLKAGTKAKDVVVELAPSVLVSTRRRGLGVRAQTAQQWREEWGNSGSGGRTSRKTWSFAPLMQPRPRVRGTLPGFPATWRGALVRVGNYETSAPGELLRITASDQEAILHATRDAVSAEEALALLLAMPPKPKRRPKVGGIGYVPPDARGRFDEHPDFRGRYHFISKHDIYFAQNPVVPTRNKEEVNATLTARGLRGLALAQRDTPGSLHMQGGATGTAVALMGVWEPFHSALEAKVKVRRRMSTIGKDDHIRAFRLQRPWIDGIEGTARSETKRLLELSSIWKAPPVMYRLTCGVWCIGTDDAMAEGTLGEFCTTMPDRKAMSPLGLTWRNSDKNGRILAELTLRPVTSKPAALPTGWFWWSWVDLEKKLTWDALEEGAEKGEVLLDAVRLATLKQSPRRRGRRKSIALDLKQICAPPTVEITGACEFDPAFGLMGKWDHHGTHNDAPLYVKRGPYSWSVWGADTGRDSGFARVPSAARERNSHDPHTNPLFLYSHRDGSWHIHGAAGMSDNAEGCVSLLFSLLSLNFFAHLRGVLLYHCICISLL